MAALSSAFHLYAPTTQKLRCWCHGPNTPRRRDHQSTRSPSGPQGMLLAEADVPDVPLLPVDGYALPVTVQC